MSNRLAIAAVTACLRNLLASALAADGDLSDAVVTAQPLDKARDPAATANQLNLFLYMISPNAAWRNQDMPGRTRSGEIASPPLALNLFYLISAYGRDNDVQQPFSQLLLGQAMSALHDHPVLGRDEIARALPNNDLGDQPERVRITLQPLSMEDISKLWAGFQMQYRLSVAYEAAVVLIDPLNPVRAGPPVLARGADGRGFPATSDLLNAYPQITSLAPNRSVRAGETLIVAGTGLGGGPLAAVFTPWRDAAPVETPANLAGDGLSATCIVPDGAQLPAGPCLIALRVGDAATGQSSNQLPMAVAPRIASPVPVKVSLKSAHGVLSLRVDPPVGPNQRAALILGSREIPAAPRAALTDQLEFPIADVSVGSYLARVRVDGVDSLPVLDPDAPIPRFDPNQRVQVTK